MYASFNWLRELCAIEASAADAAAALTRRGLTVDSISQIGDDTQFEIDIPANRPDCLGHRGLARELAAAFGLSLQSSAAAPEAAGPELQSSIAVEIKATDLCGRFTARIVRGVKIQASPAHVAKRLEVCGLRSINNVVDASNLVMLETGNPIHFFDLPKITGERIVVRRAEAGEKLTTLDGQDRELDEQMLVIADGQRAVALAGVMGGSETEIGSTTRDVLIESAWFSPNSIRRTARRTGLSTDASHRFERGVDPEGVCEAQALAVRLLGEIAGGNADPGWIDVHPAAAQAPRMTLRPSELTRLLGYSPAENETHAALGALGLEPQDAADGALEVTVPTWRVDLNREVDLVEEVARHLGYDRVPTSVSGIPTVPTGAQRADRGEVARDVLARCGFHEAYGYAMIGSGEDDRFVEPELRAPTGLTHPIVETMAVLRRSIVPGLLRALDLNRRRGARDVRLFEVGRVFHPSGDGFPAEPLRVGIVGSGHARPPHWSEPGRDLEWFDFAGLVESVLRALAPGLNHERAAGAMAAHHPGLSAHWSLEGTDVAWAGALHPDLCEPGAQATWLAEIDLDRLPQAQDAVASYRPLPNLGAVERDIAVVLPSDRTWREVLDSLCSLPSPVAVNIEAVDRYQGKPLAPGDAAITVRIRLQPDRTSLTDEIIEAYRQSLVDQLRGPLGLEIRG
jgi:phenylalanyl-tRNA synthetase beta chain